MNQSIADVAADPLQYDRDELSWADEGTKKSPYRQLFLEVLQPTLKGLQGKSVIDIGCGTGWLCEEIMRNNGKPFGLEPSVKNVQIANELYPKLTMVKSSLQDFETNERFDAVLAVMVLEHFLDIDSSFNKVASLLKPRGIFTAIVADFAKSTDENSHHPLEKEPLGLDEVAVRIDYGANVGILCDIVRTTARYERAGTLAGLTLRNHEPVLPPAWHPRFSTHQGQPIFHLLEFVKTDTAER
jgi:predicted TPR repeat methyltransferase